MDVLEEMTKFRELKERVLDLAEAIARQTDTDIDDRTIVLLRSIIDKLLG